MKLIIDVIISRAVAPIYMRQQHGHTCFIGGAQSVSAQISSRKFNAPHFVFTSPSSSSSSLSSVGSNISRLFLVVENKRTLGGRTSLVYNLFTAKSNCVVILSDSGELEARLVLAPVLVQEDNLPLLLFACARVVKLTICESRQLCSSVKMRQQQPCGEDTFTSADRLIEAAQCGDAHT